MKMLEKGRRKKVGGLEEGRKEKRRKQKGGENRNDEEGERMRKERG
jgi:hypothetical protein